MSKNKIIVGMSTLSEIRESNCIYIDKTKFIDFLENEAGTKAPVFLRPRRFGKSLTASMLHSYYDISEKEQFEKNFKGTWIYDHPTPLANSYYVLHFDFSTVSSDPSQVNRSFIISVGAGISNFSDKYPELGLSEKELDPNQYKNAAELLTKFLTNFSRNVKNVKNAEHGKAGKYLFVIIDEYDHFANEILSSDKEAFREITSTATGHEGIIKQFYAQLKAYYRGNRKGGIDRFFITGVSSVSLDSVTSGFNIATNLSDDPSLNSMVGFTYHELSEIIDRTLDFTLFPGINKEQLLKLLEENYDGYTFAIDAKETVFNSNLCLSYLRKLIALRKLPSQDEISLNDDAGKLQGMLSLCDDNVRQELINSMFNKIPIFATLPDKMNLNTTGSFDKSQTVSLLYHLGYLTIEHERSQEEGITSFVIPNKVYETLFLDYCRLAMGYRPNLNIDLSSMYGKSADIKLLLNTISEQIEKKLNPQSLARFSEMALQLICDNIINNSIKRHLCSYTEFYTGNGYADILVTNTCPDGHYFLFEFKYLPKNKNTPASIKSKSAEAYNELETYRHGSLLKEKLGSHILDCYIIVFVGSECKLFQKV